MAINEITSIDVKTLPPFKRLIMTLGELPTSYLESMTYAELLMWFCNFLQEKVLPAINNNADALQDVITYLENLDLQDEVNNKLDEMAESGQLQEIVAEYLNMKAEFVFNTVNDMKEATNLKDGSYAKTLGYYAKNDGGMSTYKIRSITNEDVIDESAIISLNNNTLVAELVCYDEVNVNAFGISAELEDNSTKINNAISYAINNNISKVTIFRPDNYNVKNPIVLYNKITFDGNNAYLNKMDNSTFENINAVMIFKSNNPNRTYANDIYLKNITLQGMNDNSTDYGLYMINGGASLYLNTVKVVKCETGIKTNNIWLSGFKDIYIDRANTIGFDCGTNGTTIDLENVYVGESVNGYKFHGIQYSNLKNVACDGVTNLCYEFIGSNLSISSLGCESPTAKYGLKFQNSFINILSSFIYINHTNAESELLQLNGSKVNINDTTFNTNFDNADFPGKFINLGSNSSLTLNKCIYPSHKFLIPNSGDSNCTLNIDGDYYSGCYVSGKVGLRDTMVHTVYHKGYTNGYLAGQRDIKNGNIWFNNYGSPMIGYDNYSSAYSRNRKVGDLFINQSNNRSGVAMWQQTTLEEKMYIVNPVTEINGNVLTIGSGITYNFEADKGRFTFKVGYEINNGNGAKGTITAITSNSITLSSVVGTFSVGDTLYYSFGTSMRDHRYKAIQQVLSGTSDERPKVSDSYGTVGIMYFDTTLNKPIWYNGTNWVDSNGNNS